MRTHYYSGGPAVDLYDLRLAGNRLPVLDGDIGFYLDLARKTGGPVLELGCGTGRVALELARGGFDVVGLDNSHHMLKIARTKLVPRPIRWVRGDMASFDLGRRFGLILSPFRAFQHLMDTRRQRSCLAAVRRHLAPNGLFVPQLFIPRLEYCIPGSDRAPVDRDSVVHPVTGNRWKVGIADRINDPLAQTLRETWVWTESDAAGREVSRREEVLTLRWTFWWEMRLLLELEGFEPVACYGDFRRGPVRYGSEQIWVVKKVPSRARRR